MRRLFDHRFSLRSVHRPLPITLPILVRTTSRYPAGCQCRATLPATLLHKALLLPSLHGSLHHHAPACSATALSRRQVTHTFPLATPATTNPTDRHPTATHLPFPLPNAPAPHRHLRDPYPYPYRPPVSHRLPVCSCTYQLFTRSIARRYANDSLSSSSPSLPSSSSSSSPPLVAHSSSQPQQRLCAVDEVGAAEA